MQELSGVSSDIIKNRGYAYKRAYKNAMLLTKKYLLQKIRNASGTLHDDLVNFTYESHVETINKSSSEVLSESKGLYA